MRCLFLIFLFCCVRAEQAGAASAVGKFVEVSGDVTVTREGGETFRVAPATPIVLRDAIETKKGAAALSFNDGSTLVLRDNTKIIVTEFLLNPKQKKRETKIDILFGKIKAVITKTFDKKSSKTELKTPTATVGIRGTEVALDVTKTKTRVFCLEGLLEVLNPAFPEQIVEVMGGKFTDILQGKLPQLPEEMSQEILDAIQNQFDFPGELNQQLEEIQKSIPVPPVNIPLPTGNLGF